MSFLIVKNINPLQFFKDFKQFQSIQMITKKRIKFFICPRIVIPSFPPSTPLVCGGQACRQTIDFLMLMYI